MDVLQNSHSIGKTNMSHDNFKTTATTNPIPIIQSKKPPKKREPYLESWEISLNNKIHSKEEFLRKIVHEHDKISKLLTSQISTMDALHKNMEDILEQMRLCVQNYVTETTQHLEEYHRNSNKHDLEDKGDKIFELFQKMHNNACHFFSRTEFTEIISPLNSRESVSLFDHLQKYWNPSDPPKLEDETWLECKNSIWSLKVYYSEMVKEYTELKKEVEKINNTKINITKKQEAVEKEFNILIAEREEVKNFSERIKNFRQSSPLSISSSPENYYDTMESQLPCGGEKLPLSVDSLPNKKTHP